MGRNEQQESQSNLPFVEDGFFFNHVANVTCTDLEIIILSEVSPTEKSKYHRILGKRIEMDLFIKQKQTHRVRE